MKKLAIPLALLFIVSGCAQHDQSETTAPQSGVRLENFDTSVRPQDDFYHYVNGTWLEKTEIPADKSNYGVFTVLAENARRDIHEIILAAAEKNTSKGSTEQKVGDLFNSYMNTQRIEQLGLSPLHTEISRIDKLSSKQELAEYFAEASKIGTSAPLNFYVSPDSKQPEQYIANFVHTGLGMPDRDYYLDPNDKYKKIRQDYKEHIQIMFSLAGWPNPQQSANTILQLETELAKAHWTRVERRERDKTYNKYAVSELNILAPEFYWQAYLQSAGIQHESDVIIRTPSFYTAFNKIFANTSLSDWKIYQRWHLLSSYAPLLSNEFDQANFDFYGQVLSGTESQEARWERGVDTVNSLIGEAVGKEYVERHFSPKAKERMMELVENLRAAYHDSILELDWMGEETKQQAIEKLQKFHPKIGYPDKWKDYSALQIEPDDLVGNVRRATEFHFNDNIDKLGKPVDYDEWFMTPQTVNAYYNPSMNEIVFPAAILQPPFFNPNADDAVNYGAIGGVIGHEMGHGFDDQGAKSDGDGRLRNWWTDTDLKEFKKRTQKLVEQYSQYEPLTGEYVNGQLTLGENIGDLGGLTIAYKAYQKSLGDQQAPMIDGFTGDQRFFIGWAQVWPRKYREQELHRRLSLDPHSPSEYRTNGVVRNMPEFYQAFNVTESDELYLPPNERVKIW